MSNPEANEQPRWLARLTKYEELTNAEMQSLGDLITRLNQFSSGDLRTCPICDQSIEKLYCWHGIEYVVLYVRPCGCRLGCWEDAPAWAVEAGIVDHDSRFLEEASHEPTCAELREDYPDEDWTGCEDDPIDYDAQERAGQKRLPGFDDDG